MPSPELGSKLCGEHDVLGGVRGPLSCLLPCFSGPLSLGAAYMLDDTVPRGEAVSQWRKILASLQLRAEPPSGRHVLFQGATLQLSRPFFKSGWCGPGQLLLQGPV